MTIVGKEPNDHVFGTIQNCLGTIYSARIELIVRRFVEMVPEKGTDLHCFLFEGHQQENWSSKRGIEWDTPVED